MVPFGFNSHNLETMGLDFAFNFQFHQPRRDES